MMTSLQSVYSSFLKKNLFSQRYREVIASTITECRCPEDKQACARAVAHGPKTKNMKLCSLQKCQKKNSPSSGLVNSSTSAVASLCPTAPSFGRTVDRRLLLSTAERNREVMKNEQHKKIYDQALETIRTIQEKRASMHLDNSEVTLSSRMSRPEMTDKYVGNEIRQCVKPRSKDTPVGQRKPKIEKTTVFGRITKPVEPQKVISKKIIKKRIKLSRSGSLQRETSITKFEDYFKTQLNRVDLNRVSMINDFATIAMASRSNKALNFGTISQIEKKPIKTRDSNSTEKKPTTTKTMSKIKEILERASSLTSSLSRSKTEKAIDKPNKPSQLSGSTISTITMDRQGLKDEFRDFREKLVKLELTEVELLNEFATLQIKRARKDAKFSG